jgi:hypothetical protein
MKVWFYTEQQLLSGTDFVYLHSSISILLEIDIITAYKRIYVLHRSVQLYILINSELYWRRHNKTFGLVIKPIIVNSLCN